MSGEWKFKQENMPRQTAKQKTDCTLTRRLADYAAGAAYPFHMPGHANGGPAHWEAPFAEALDITEIRRALMTCTMRMVYWPRRWSERPACTAAGVPGCW